MNSRSLAKIKRSGLQRHLVRRPSHLSAESIYFIDQMPLSRTSDGGVAGHIGNRLEGHSEEHGVHSRPCRRKSRLNACVPCAYNGNFCKFCHNLYILKITQYIIIISNNDGFVKHCRAPTEGFVASFSFGGILQCVTPPAGRSGQCPSKAKIYR